MKKTLFFDVETTGLDPVKNSIIQISGIIDIDGVIAEEFNYFCAPDKDAEISTEALKVIGKTKEELLSYPLPDVMYSQFLTLIEKHVDKYDKSDKFYPAGYNVRFDLDFIQSFFKKRGNQFGTGSYQNWRVVDVLSIAHYLNYTGKLDLENYKLATVCKHFGIEIKAHDAMSDIRATRELFLKIKL